MPEAAELVENAHTLYRQGAVADALAACEAAAAEARGHSDWAALADAAVVVRLTTNAHVSGRVHALCVEALARLGDNDPVRAARVRAQLVATANPFHPPEPLDLPPESDDPEAAFLRLQAQHAARLAIDHLPERLEVAERAVDLGVRTGTDEYAAWGRRWRMDAYAILGDRVDLAAELAALGPLVDRLGSRAWRAYLSLVECSQRLLEGRFADAARLADEAVAVEADPAGEAAFFRVVTGSAIAQQTGLGLEDNIAAVTRIVDRLPYFARGWLCLMLKAAGRRDEAETLWRSVAPHVQRMPTRAPEWLIASIGNAEVCAWLGDRHAAGVLYTELAPYAGLHAIGLASTPYDGPVDLALGRLAAVLGDRNGARDHLTSALRACEVLHALPYAALTSAELAALEGVDSAAGRAHAERARVLATRLGMTPLLARLPAQAADHPLTRREIEIAGLVSEGLSNAAIGRRLVLSERTVENHVSSVLRKLVLTSRAGIASWHVSRAAGTAPR